MKLYSLQYIRGVAAISVALYHMGVYTRSQTGDATLASIFGGSFGTVGVLAFFALSGYLMAVQSQRLAGRPARFLLHRVARIFPIFWIVCLLRAGLSAAIPDARQIDPLTLGLAPVGVRSYALGVEWTLVYEVVFYICIWLLLLVRGERKLPILSALWLAAIVAASWRGGDTTPQLSASILTLLLSANCAAFAAGALMQSLPASVAGRAAFALGGAVVLVASQTVMTGAASVILAGAGCAAVVAWGATIATPAPTSLRWLERLGDWSFAIYLVHVPVITVVLMVVGWQPPLLLLALELAAVLIVGALVGMFDVSLYRHIRRACDALPSIPRLVACASFFALFFGTMALAHQNLPGAKPLPPQLASLDAATGEAQVKAAFARSGYTEDEYLRGNVDVFDRGETGLSLVGWANNPRDFLNRTRVLIVTLGHGVTSLPPRNYRMDVLRAIGDADIVTPIGIERILPDTACPVGMRWMAVIVSPKTRTYRTFDERPCPPAAPVRSAAAGD